MADLKTGTTNINDFFSQTEKSYKTISALGFDYWDMDSGTTSKLYEATHASQDDANRFGIIPATYNVKPDLINILKTINFPAKLECEVVTIPGSKNKSTNQIISIKGH